VTATCATGTQDIADVWADTGEALVWLLARSIDWIGNNKVLVPPETGDMLLLLCPDFAAKIARDGLDVPAVQRMLLEWTRAPVERWHRSVWPKLEARDASTTAGVAGRQPRAVLLAVAGGEGRAPRRLLLHLRAHLVGEPRVPARRDGRDGRGV